DKAMGIERIHPTLVDYMTEQSHKGTAFDDLPDADQELVKTETMEAYLSYAFLQQAGKQHAKLKTDLRNEYAHGIDKFPKDRQTVLHLLDKYSKQSIVQTVDPQGTSFAQQGGRGRGRDGRGRGRGSGRGDAARGDANP
ncbi:MAG: hypothetical protein ACRCZI_11310, partial [Cetobacterium sp.]